MNQDEYPELYRFECPNCDVQEENLTKEEAEEFMKEHIEQSREWANPCEPMFIPEHEAMENDLIRAEELKAEGLY